MATIIGDTSKIRNAASDIRDDTSSFGSLAKTMFDRVEALKTTFTSVDGQNYIAKITSYRDGFDKLQKTLEAAASALELAATNYEGTIEANMGNRG